MKINPFSKGETHKSRYMKMALWFCANLVSNSSIVLMLLLNGDIPILMLVPLLFLSLVSSGWFQYHYNVFTPTDRTFKV